MPFKQSPKVTVQVLPRRAASSPSGGFSPCLSSPSSRKNPPDGSVLALFSRPTGRPE
ncbi:MAG: hypothetical protein ACOVSW_08730 [Candidatus Kapaibacteriota bacterium]